MLKLTQQERTKTNLNGEIEGKPFYRLPKAETHHDGRNLVGKECQRLCSTPEEEGRTQGWVCCAGETWARAREGADAGRRV